MAEVKPPSASVGPDNSNERRRTHRIQIVMPVIVRGKSGNHPFQEETHTVSVNANGCMVRLEARVTRLQPVSIINPKTAEELPCRVTFLGQRHGTRTEVGLEFTEASPLFWRIAFPPEDWDPAERKRPSGSCTTTKHQP
jgi:PilZ domain